MGWAPVELGKHSYEVQPQRMGYLERHLSGLTDLINLDVEDGNIIAALGDKAHSVLAIFIPGLMPEWEWKGYASQTAAEHNQYDEEADSSPTFDQIVTAFEVAMKVNRLDLFKHLGKLVGTDFLRAAVRKAIADSLMETSPSSSPPSTE